MKGMRRSVVGQFTPFAGAVILILLGLTGCMSLSENKPPGAWHDAYQPIDDPASFAFVSNGLARATAEFGEPTIPVKQVLLRRSRRTKEARRYRIAEDFSLTQCVDSTSGLFVIYIGVDPDHRNYYALLGHECAHLINPKITDWYMEGIATVFSEEFCESINVDWGNWRRNFMRSRRDAYALSYQMMQELKDIFPVEYPALLQNPLSNEKGGAWLRIDIDSWLDSLPEGRLPEALGIIEPHCSILQKKTNEQYTFKIPEALQ